MKANEPLLPSELEREIFETAALSHPETIPPLLRVARRSLIWIEPLLYRVVRIESDIDSDGDSPQTDAFKFALKAKPPRFFQGATRHLFLSHTAKWTADEILHALQVCTALVDLAFLPAFDPSFLPIIVTMPLRCLSGWLVDLCGSKRALALALPLFTSITHLDLFDSLEKEDFHLISAILAMPSLTHLCLNESIPWPIADALLADSPRLRVLLVAWNEGAYEAAQRHAEGMPVRVRDDLRFVMTTYNTFQAVWNAGAVGKPNYWSDADDFVARRRAGLVDKSSYWITQ